MTHQPSSSARVRPDADYMTKEIIEEEALQPHPQIAPDIPQPIDPGPVLGVVRDGDDGSPSGSVVSLTPGLVTTLQSAQGYPCVSLLLTTRPGPRLHQDDAQRLERLRADALRRLRTENRPDDHDLLVADLDRVVQQAVRAETHRGLAIYAGVGVATAVRLPVEVDERAVIDPTFATRDLVRALHRTPRHLVLVLSPRRATLFDGAGGRLQPVESRFPITLARRGGDSEDPARFGSGFRRLDLVLGAYLRLHPAPVVVVGPQALVTAFRSSSRNLGRLAGTVYGAFDDVGVEELARRTAPVLTRYLASREAAALELLARRRAEGRVASGIGQAWLAARANRPEMLIVEEGFRYPARLSEDGDLPAPAPDVEAPDVIDDLVDELIEGVLARGGWVALAQDGALAGDGRVALTTR